MNDEDQVRAHLSDGYRNAQETIRALDMKTNILTALSVFCFTAILGMLKLMWDYICLHPEDVSACLGGPLCSLLIHAALPVVLLGSLFVGAICIWCCLSALTARSPDPENAYVSTTMLFPYIPPRKLFKRKLAKQEQQQARAYYDKIREGQLTLSDIRAEYHNQITNVGAILGQKILWNRYAVNWFRAQVLTVPVAAVLTAILKCF